MSTTTLSTTPTLMLPRDSALTTLGTSTRRIDVKLRRAQTAGRLSVCEMIVPVGAGAPYHLHDEEDEFFFVVDGEVDVIVDGRALHVAAGQGALGPRGVPHCFQSTGSRTVRMLTVSAPGGLDEFFVELFGLLQGSELPGAEVLNPLYRRHAMVFLGPTPVFPAPSLPGGAIGKLLRQGHTRHGEMVDEHETSGRMGIRKVWTEAGQAYEALPGRSRDGWCYVLEGRGQLMTGTGHERLQKGDSFWVPRSEWAAVETTSGRPLELLEVRF